MADHSEKITMNIGPLAEKVDEVTSKVKNTTRAVVLMQSAVIAAEKESRETICKSVNRGFYSLISSQLSQKIAASKSKANAELAQLKNLSDRIAGTRIRAQEDYQRISGRYFEIFKKLDDNLRIRIQTLNKNAFQLAETKKNRFFQIPSGDSASTFCLEKDTQPASQKIVGANLKMMTDRALKTIADRVEEQESYDLKLATLTASGNLATAREKFAPVAVVEAKNLDSDAETWNFELPQHIRLENSDQIKEICISDAQKGEWRDVSETERQKILDGVIRIPEFSGLEKRVSETMQKMMAEDKWQVWTSGGNA